MNNFAKTEERILNAYDSAVLVDWEDGTDMYTQYVNSIFRCYIQELIIEDIRNSGVDETREEKLLNAVGNIDVMIPKALVKYYKDHCSLTA